jgi:RsiW-degrading membrane proteinase PrsW (M82 family)
MILFAVDQGVWIVLAIAAVPICLLPAYLADRKDHPQKNAIFVLSLLLGWTFFGWAVAMVWVFSYTPKEQELPPLIKRRGDSSRRPPAR